MKITRITISENEDLFLVFILGRNQLFKNEDLFLQKLEIYETPKNGFTKTFLPLTQWFPTCGTRTYMKCAGNYDALSWRPFFFFFIHQLELGKNNQAGTQLLKKVEKGWQPLVLTKCYEKHENIVILEYCTVSKRRGAFLTVKIEILGITLNK